MAAAGHQRPARRAHDRRQGPLVATVQRPRQRRLTPLQRRARQQEQAQRRRDEQGDEHGRGDRQQVGQDQWREERAGQALHEEHRQHHHRHDDRRGGGRAAHLDRGVEDDLRRRRVVAVLATLAQPSGDVLDVDHRVVDDGAEGHHQPCQDDGVDGGTAQVQHGQGRHERQQHRQDADQRAAPLEQEDAEHHQQQQRADEQRRAEVAERRLDEARRPEQAGVDLDALETGGHGGERLLDAPGHLEGVGAGELLDDQQQPGAVAEDGVADERLVVLHHVGHVADPQRLAVGQRLGAVHGHLGEVVGVDDGEDVPDAEPLVGGVDEPAGTGGGRLQEGQRRHPQRVAGGLHELVEGDPFFA
jgi:hypothetical protein